MKRRSPARIQSLESRRLLASSYIDPNFGTSGGDGPYLPGGTVDEIKALSGGRTLFATANATSFTLGRMLSDGRTLDPSFNGTGYLTFPMSSQPSVTDLELLANGDARVLVNYGGVARVYAITDAGLLDLTYGTAGFVSIGVAGRYAYGAGMAAVPGGGFYVAGTVGNGNTFTNADSLMARITAGGQIDTAFGGGIRVVNRSVDPSITNDNFSDVVVLPDGRPVGFGTYYYSLSRAKLARFDVNGNLDTAWPTAPNGGNVSNIGGSGKMTLDSNGRIFIAVDATTSSGTQLIRMRTSDGALDTIYGEAGFSYPPRPVLNSESMSLDFVLLPDGSAYTISNYRVSSQPSYSLITAILPSGSADQSFASLGVYKVYPSEYASGLGALRAIDIHGNGQLVIAGRGDSTGSFLDRYLVQDPTNVFTTVTGRVFNDPNGNGALDPGELAMRVLVYEDENGNNTREETERAVLSDGTTGEYVLTHLAPGVHRIRTLQLFDYVYTVGFESGYFITTSTPGSVLSGYDFGLRRLTVLRGEVWDDQDVDGFKDGNEPMLPGVNVYLDANRNGLYDPDELQRMTGANGVFEFIDIAPGSGWFGFNLPAGYVQREFTLEPRSYLLESGSSQYSSFAAYRPALAVPQVFRAFHDVHTGASPFMEFAFSEDVAASVHASDFLIRNTGTQAYLSDSLKRVELVPWRDKTYVRLWIEPTLPDGRYELTIAPASIVDADGNALLPMTPMSFQYLEGDLTSDGVVNFDDVFALIQRYGTSGKHHGQGNLNRDPEGLVDFADLLILVQLYRRTLSTEPTAQPARRSVAADVLEL